MTLCFFMICSASLSTFLFSNIDVLPKKEIIFEGSYSGITSESLDGNKSKFNSYEYSEIKFFTQEPKELDLIDFQRPTSQDTVEEAQAKLADIRNTTKEILRANNMKVIGELSDLAPMEQFIIGDYCPIVKLRVDSSFINEKNVRKISNALNRSEIIEEVYISEVSNNSSNELANALDAIHVTQNGQCGSYTGKGINIGIVEGTRVRANYSDFNDRNIRYFGSSIYDDLHADQVAMIAAGNYGIARGSNIFSAIGTPANTDYLKEIIENNVNVINTSFGIQPGESGSYTSVVKEIDSIIKNSFVTIVGSAGNSNNSYPSSFVTTPKTGYNYITVGAADDKEFESNPEEGLFVRATYSAYAEQGDTYGGHKPNLCATGNVATNAYGGGVVGTSFAAPQVAGCIALLMEEFPYLVAYPELCLSIVTASASPMAEVYNTSNGENRYENSGLHNEIGSGMLNYQQMREAAKNYISITRKSNSSTGFLDNSLTFTANKNQRVRASLAWLSKGTDTNNLTDYDLYLQRVNSDGTYSTLKRIIGGNNNVEFLDYTFEYGGKYRLAINQCGINASKDFIALSYVLIDDLRGSTSGGDTVAIKTDTLNPTDYDFAGEYNFSEISKNVTTAEGNTIVTKRLRCGYILDNYLTMSAKSKNAGTAYLEYDLSNYIYGVSYNLGLWSDDESLIQKSSIRLEALDSSGTWRTIRTFYAKNMSMSKDNLLQYYDIIPFRSRAFRFIVETNQVQNENNRGRVVIGNIEIKQLSRDI